MADRFCDGAHCTPYAHAPGCTHRTLRLATTADLPALAAAEDGYPTPRPTTTNGTR
ncbi:MULTISPECIES: hypothetical protein [Streptomyces]|uniref:Uncharacterized protein n=1 Tax=Streptomyces fradiae ATCC 10745 = DSM 40063 TaxID=1319510 RepID=A0A1Y2NSY9_STRFR|nr:MULTISPECIES: hypothetical protein [Streptomyces]OSY50450.1 hypothetical protein BG846_03928 [Streptomyces fradiae ATCC 10745 = DSM 40063]